jgi:general secretion pathway protein G
MKSGRRFVGFTLIELVVTVAIVGVIASGALPLAEIGFKRAKEQELRSALREIRGAIDAYKVAVDQGRVASEPGTSGYPEKLTALVDGVDDQRSPEATKIYFLRRLPRDPFFPDPGAAAEDTWGLRSYASSADDPQPGGDIFDVYSLSTAQAINGTPYRSW